MTYRMGKLQPWYHQPKPRCDATTLTGKMQCINSATYEGGTTKTNRVKLCKTHADMADFPVKLIQARSVLIRDE